MLPNLAVLQSKCEALSLDFMPTDGKKLGKKHCVDALRTHFLPEGGLPYEEVTPMICFAEWNLKEEELGLVWRSSNWGAQRKLNGCRLILHFVKGVGIFAHSRTVSVKTFRFEELTSKLLIRNFKPSFSATVDCEVLIEKPVDTSPYTPNGEVTKTSLHSTTAALHLSDENSLKLQEEQDAPLQFHVFDVMLWEGMDIKKKPLKEREKFRTEFERLVKSEDALERDFHFPEIRILEKKAFMKEVIKDGGEGLILKNMKSPYVDSSSRRRDAWVKAKRRQEYDAFVTGFKRGEAGKGYENLVGALEFSVNLEGGGTHVLGFGSNLTLETRKKISIYDAETDKVSLNPAVYWKVAEISGQDISARELRLSHCTIDRWRPKQGPDAKSKDQCTLAMSALTAASAWVGS